jgi:hypothetical protein
VLPPSLRAVGCLKRFAHAPSRPAHVCSLGGRGESAEVVRIALSHLLESLAGVRPTHEDQVCRFVGHLDALEQHLVAWTDRWRRARHGLLVIALAACAGPTDDAHSRPAGVTWP